nr:ATP-dependent RNA helicase vasa-like [Leptinotarsa decemlineata]
MDDDWDDGDVISPASANVGFAAEGGKKFTAGRGFKAVNSNVDDWKSNNFGGNIGGFSDKWGDSESKNTGGNNRGSRGRRGGGRGGGRGGFRERNGDGNDGWGDDTQQGGFDDFNAENDNGGHGGRGRGRGRGRGGGERGRGGRGGGRERDGDRGFGSGENGFDKQKGESGEEVKREIYIPPERTTDEELFTSTICSGINFIKLDEIEVNVSGEDVPPPLASFQQSGLRPHLLENIKKSGYDKPTPIQKYAIPIIMKGRDLMGCAQTGSGKTAAFLLPMINQLLSSQEAPVTDGNCCQPKVVIVSPTRELAIQIFEQAKKFAYNSIVKTVVAYGGTSVNHQKNHVLMGCHILVATPGRLNDFVKRGHISFASIQYFVLDEADRMLDMGFLPTVEQMLSDSSMRATGERQTLMFSATFPEQIQHLAGKFLHNYIFIAVGIVGSASTDVQQIFHQVSKFDKRDKLLSMLQEGRNERTVVFVETKRTADFLATLLSENDIKTTSIHGDRLQREREQALWDFKKGICNILVATGVAARGLDIEGIQHVINYDLPNSIDEYVHRIGRTGRVGNRGKATSFFDSAHDTNIAGDLGKILKQAGQDVPDWLANGCFSSGGNNDSFGGRDIRGNDFGKAQNYNTQPAEETEEDW